MTTRRIVLALVICLGAGSGCAPRETAVEVGNRTQTLHLGNSVDPPDLDPHTNVSAAVSRIGSALNEGLVNLANDGATIKPGLAKSWDISPDGLIYTFHLREDAKWSNGTPLVADDYVAGLQRFLTPLLAAEGVNIAFPIVGAQDYAEGRNTDPSSIGVFAPDAHTVVIHFRFRAPYFLSLLTDSHLVPLYGPMLDEFEGRTQRGGRWTLPGNFVSNGPFTLTTWKPNVVVTAAKNPHYWNANAISLHEVHFYPIEDPGTEERAFRAGQIHVTNQIPTSKLSVYLEKHDGVLHSTPILASNFISFNTTQPPFNDARVRRAFSLTIDRERLMSSVMKGQGVPAYTFTPPTAGGYDLPSLAHYDVPVARQLLAEAGYPDGVKFPHLELLLSSKDEATLNLGQALQEMWKVGLGIDIRIAPTEFKVWLDHLRNRSHIFTTSNWNLGVNDPIDTLALAVSHNPNNDAYWVSPAYDASFDAINQATNEEERRAAILECERLINAEAPWAPLFISTRNQLVHPSVQGWQGNPLQAIDWTTISLRSK